MCARHGDGGISPAEPGAACKFCAQLGLSVREQSAQSQPRLAPFFCGLKFEDLRLGGGNLFFSEAEILEQAYALQGEKIAYDSRAKWNEEAKREGLGA